MTRKHTISEGKLVLALQQAQEGGFVVSSPMDPGIWTEAETISGAFANPRDALHELAAVRRQMTTKRRTASPAGRVA